MNIDSRLSIGKYALLLVLAVSLVSATDAAANISNALVSLCSISKAVLGVGVMLMIILAGAIYAVGQVLGAETRARATVWATAMLTGAVIGVIIYIVTPVIVGAIISGGGVTVSC